MLTGGFPPEKFQNAPVIFDILFIMYESKLTKLIERKDLK